jgi:chemotaxis response regulator CheB
MGRDGAAGLLAMRKSGALTIAQDAETSVVYGMPKAAAEINGASEILPLELIGRRICEAVLHKTANVNVAAPARGNLVNLKPRAIGSLQSNKNE